MAPEIVAHHAHCYFKADIWALGVILYALLSGKFPFKAQQNKDLYNKIRKGIFTVPDGITLEAKNILLSMLQTDPRYRKSTQSLLKDSWFLENQEKSLEASHKEIKQKSIIMGTIEKYKKIYGGHRRNLAREIKCVSEGRKKVSKRMPYQLNKTP